MRICPYSPDHDKAVISLWERCGLIRPWNDPKKDIARKIAIDPDLFLIGLEGESIVGTIMVGYEGHRGWINYLAIDPDHRRKDSLDNSCKRRSGCSPNAVVLK
jgi:hypothetical protein